MKTFYLGREIAIRPLNFPGIFAICYVDTGDICSTVSGGIGPYDKMAERLKFYREKWYMPNDPLQENLRKFGRMFRDD